MGSDVQSRAMRRIRVWTLLIVGRRHGRLIGGQLPEIPPNQVKTIIRLPARMAEGTMRSKKSQVQVPGARRE